MFQKHVKDRTMQKQEELRGSCPGADTQLRGRSQVILLPTQALHNPKGRSDCDPEPVPLEERGFLACKGSFLSLLTLPWSLMVHLGLL